MSAVQDRVCAIAAEVSGVRLDRISASSAVWQDIRMYGEDVDDYAEALAKEFGNYVWDWPWHRFTNLNESGALFVPALIWQLITWPFRGSFSYPDPYERLELGHIAAVIERGSWFEP